MTDQTAALTRYETARNRLIKDLLDDGFCLRLTEATDAYFRSRLEEVLPDPAPDELPFALFALGGYGRREMSPASDIDLLLLYPGQVPDEAEVLVQKLLHPLWDLGLDLGHGVRTAAESLALGQHNFEVLTAMLDLRLIRGSTSIAHNFQTELDRMLLDLEKPYTHWLHKQYLDRGVTFSDASGLLEPNVKEAWGGLRDYHHILWLGRICHQARSLLDLETSGILSHQERISLEKHVRYVLKVRNQLHRMSPRRNDRLYLELQPDIAAALNISRSGDVPAVEIFLSQLHRNMTGIKVICRSFWNLHLPSSWPSPAGTKGLEELLGEGLTLADGSLWFISPERITSAPELLMHVFKASALTGYPLAWETRRLVEEFTHLVDDSFRTASDVREAFLKILLSDRADKSLESMQETGLLAAYLPEFAPAQDLVQYDAYHLHPVGRHQVETVGRLLAYRNSADPFLGEFLEEVSDSLEVRLAALLHDIGKGGDDHADQGAAMADRLLGRLGLDETTTDDVIFLIQNHLALVEAATRRDLEEESTVMDCAGLIKDERRLKSLMLLTWADAMATGPKAWNPWMENLLRELFFKVLKIFQERTLSGPHVFHRLATARDRIRTLLSSNLAAEKLEPCLDAMPARYLLHYSPEDIVHHIGLLNRIPKAGSPARFQLDARSESSGRIWELTLVARGEPGLFTPMAGVLSLRGINIYSADLNLWQDGTVVDVFRVAEPPDPLYAAETWERIASALKDVLTGRLALDYRLSVKKTRGESPPIPGSGKVRIDNHSSDFYTLIEVIADDRTGLLYALGKTLNDLRLSITFATIATHLDQVADVFYVQDFAGEKIGDPRQVEEIRSALKHVLNRNPAP